MSRKPTFLSWNRQTIILVASVLFVFLGAGFRFYKITQSNFIFYDEGYYLNFNRPLAEIIAQNYPLSGENLRKAVGYYFLNCLSTGKALWFMIADLRFFWNGFDQFWYPRLVSAVCGILTVGLTFLFARKYFDNQRVAWMSAALLAVLPSHVFYSRLGLQESACTLLVLSGFYFYLMARWPLVRIIAGGLIFSAAYFSNYRLIILPFLVLAAEMFQAFSRKQSFDTRRFVWFCVLFAAVIVFVGNIDHGRNAIVTFSWMFHQEHLAERSFDWINVLSYPYYLFRLENIVFGLLFWANLYFAATKRWAFLLPFVLSCAQMFVFSFAGEKGARYICVVTPFIAMSVAHLVEGLMEKFSGKPARWIILAMILSMSAFMACRSGRLAAFDSAQDEAVEFLKSQTRNVKFMSTQNYVEGLFLPDAKYALPPPRDARGLLAYYGKGYRYLIVDPQAYVSWTKDEKRFQTELGGYIQFLVQQTRPSRRFTHFTFEMMERFVFEHSENLVRSISFLNVAKKHDMGEIRVYDLQNFVTLLLRYLLENGTS